MKTVVSIMLILVCLALPVVAAELDFVKVKSVDTAIFRVGYTYSISGSLCYVVDRTTGMCFAMMTSQGPTGITKIDCEPLKKIEVIKTYIETGKLP